MRAAVFEGIETINIREVEKPRCSEDGILIKIHSCGICGSDIRNFHRGLRHGIDKQIMGHEFSGVVEEVGENVSQFHVGDRIAVAPDVSCGECYYCERGLVNLCNNHRMVGTHWPGGFAEYVHLPKVVLQRGMVHKVPSAVSLEDAAISEPASSVIASQEYNSVSLGDTVLIIGDGPIGCLHIEIARARGASKIIMVGLKKLKLAARFEPDLLLDAAKDALVCEVRKATNGLGVDIAICANPVTKTQGQAVEAVKKRGTVVLFGGVPKDNPMTLLNSNVIHYHEIKVVGAFSYPKYIHEKALKLIGDGKIHAQKYFTIKTPLEEIEKGFHAMESGEALKVLITM